jgi:hypothetical protein
MKSMFYFIFSFFLVIPEILNEKTEDIPKDDFTLQ